MSHSYIKRKKKEKEKTVTMNDIDNILLNFSELPYLFIGSGVSIRYLNLPNWENLLRHFAALAKPQTDFAYETYYNQAKGNCRDDLLLPRVASLIGKDFDQAWLQNSEFNEERKRFGDLVRQNISPFKISLANYIAGFSKRTDDQHLLDELSCLKNVAKRSIAGVITTNYDQLAEEIFEGYNVYVGQEELLFSETNGIMEIFKIHGCCQKPNSIVINQEDYEIFNKRNAYLAAKLLTVFVEHPIIFLGYSLSDSNIQRILKEIANCLSKDYLEKLQNRLIFVEYTPENKNDTEVRSHSIELAEGECIDMTRIMLADYLPLFKALLRKRYNYNPKILRQLKRDIYQMVSINKPVDRFKVADIENDEDLSNIQTVVGVGVQNGSEEDYSSIATNSNHNIPEAEQLYRDILFDDGNFNIRSLVEDALGHLLKHHSNSLPIHKYLYLYEKETNEEPPLEIAQNIKQSLNDFRNKTIQKKMVNGIIKENSIPAIRDNYDDEEAITLIPAIPDESIDIESLKEFLTSYLTNNPQALSTSGQNLKTELKRLIKMYDWLQYGQKKSH